MGSAGRSAGGVPPPGLPRRPDDGRPGDDRAADREGRPDVPRHPRPPRPAGARPRRDRAAPGARQRPPAGAAARSRRRGPHPPGTEELWNESWYFDAVSADGQLGVYTRLGLYPNLGVSWMTTFVCGPGRRTLALIDFAAPLPEGEAAVAGDRRAAGGAHLHRAAGELRGAGAGRPASPTDAAAILRGERGDPVELALGAALGHDRRAVRLPGRDPL